MKEHPNLFLLVNMPIEPVAKERPRSTAKGQTYTPARTREAEKVIGTLLRAANRNSPPVDEPVGVALHFDCTSRRRNDVDNLAKLVLDAANGIVWTDDRHVAELHVTRTQGAATPRVQLQAWLIGEVAA
jgi:Holliday junction resolvase RusA-like endonuclease